MIVHTVFTLLCTLFLYTHIIHGDPSLLLNWHCSYCLIMLLSSHGLHTPPFNLRRCPQREHWERSWEGDKSPLSDAIAVSHRRCNWSRPVITWSVKLWSPPYLSDWIKPIVHSQVKLRHCRDLPFTMAPPTICLLVQEEGHHLIRVLDCLSLGPIVHDLVIYLKIHCKIAKTRMGLTSDLHQ